VDRRAPQLQKAYHVEFDRPQVMSRLAYEAEEADENAPRRCAWRSRRTAGRTYCQILVQEYNFSPGGATYQHEDQRFNRRQVSQLRLSIVPNKNGSGTATLTALHVYA
jgi:hypothetical protein